MRNELAAGTAGCSTGAADPHSEPARRRLPLAPARNPSSTASGWPGADQTRAGRGGDRELAAIRAALSLHPYDTVLQARYGSHLERQRSPCEASAIGLIITCEKYFERALQLHARLSALNLFALRLVVGRGAAVPTHADLLEVDAPDDYESLPRKVRAAFVGIHEQHGSAVFKIDDDLRIADPGRLRESVRGLLGSGLDYAGFEVAGATHDRTWHWGKCRDPALNGTPYGRRYVGPWANGPFYYLSARALRAFTLAMLRFPAQIEGELYEDKFVGDTLRAEGIPLSPLDAASVGVAADNLPSTVSLQAPTAVEHAGRSTSEAMPAPKAFRHREPAEQIMSLPTSDPATEPALPIRSRRSLQTFDIFDTLIARRCIEARQIFDEVEARTGLVGFAAARIEAEAQIQHREYTLADIYGGLRRSLSLAEQAAEELMRTEVLIELENVVPIAGQIRELPQEAVLITDMYLPVPVIREMLRRAGIAHDYPILIAAHGKAGGEVWRHLAAQGFQCVHVGDNVSSDVRVARACGMRARLTRVATPSAFERFLLARGAPAAARALRAARLQTVAVGVPEWLYRLQFELNLPFLLTSAIDLLHKASASGSRKVLFASRDGRNLQAAFEVLRDKFNATGGLQAQYWYTSRYARTRSSPTYLGYCREALCEQALVADLCGTGASMTALMRDMPADTKVAFYVAQKLHDKGYRDRMASCYGLGSSEQLLNVQHTFTTQGFVDNGLLEQLNYAPEGMVRDVLTSPFGALPIRDAPDFDAQGLALIEAQQRMLIGFLQTLKCELDDAASQQLLQATPLTFAWLHESIGGLSAELGRLRESLGADDASNEALTQHDLSALRHRRQTSDEVRTPGTAHAAGAPGLPGAWSRLTAEAGAAVAA
jgi:FMN phosphatase YigB (HAD superfamily)